MLRIYKSIRWLDISKTPKEGGAILLRLFCVDRPNNTPRIFLRVLRIVSCVNHLSSIVPIRMYWVVVCMDGTFYGERVFHLKHTFDIFEINFT